jgi:hypothetical protein
MVPTLFFYELGLIALVWLFLMLCWRLCRKFSFESI